MKKLAWLIPAILLGFGSLEARTVDRILAQVNDDIITLSEVNRTINEQGIRQQLATKYSGDELEQKLQEAQKQVLESIIQEKLLYQKAMDLGFNAETDTRVSTAVQRLIKERDLKDNEGLEKALEEQGLTLKELRENYRKSIVVDDLIGYFVSSRITLLAPEIDKYYKDHIAEFSSPEEVTLSDIEIAMKGNPKEAEERANDIYRQLQQGESFPALASQYSNGISASRGGSIGTYLLSTLNSNTAKAIANLKDGEVSKPQREKDAFVIYRLDNRKVTAVRPLEEVRDQIKDQLYMQKFNPELTRYVSQLREDAYIQYFTEIK